MATIDATAGGSSSNSYVTQAEADTHFDGRLDEDFTWAGAAFPVEALITAARRLDQETWKGIATDSDQALAWPRYGVKDKDGRQIANDAIPTAVKRAQMELAWALLSDDDFFSDTGLEGFKSLKVGPLEMETRMRPAGNLPANVRREIDHLLANSGANISMERG